MIPEKTCGHQRPVESRINQKNEFLIHHLVFEGVSNRFNSEKETMKVLILLLMVFLSACGSSSSKLSTGVDSSTGNGSEDNGDSTEPDVDSGSNSGSDGDTDPNPNPDSEPDTSGGSDVDEPDSSDPTDPDDTVDSGDSGDGDDAGEDDSDPVDQEDPEPVTPSVVIDKTVLERLLTRLEEVQNDDGSFDWYYDITTLLTPETTGAQNVTGITVIGIFEAQSTLASSAGQVILDQVMTYLDPLLNLLLAAPEDTTKNLACPNWTVMGRYLEASSDTTLQAEVVDTFEALLNARDTKFGDDASRRVDGLMNRIKKGRSATLGIIPWDMGLCVEALSAMKNIDSRFEVDYRDAVTVLIQYLQDTYIPSLEAGLVDQYAALSVSMSLLVLDQDEMASDNEDTLATLETLLLGFLDTNGLLMPDFLGSDQRQDSAYVLLALKQTQYISEAQVFQDYLESEVDALGRVIELSSNLESFEIDGEVLRALSFKP